MTRTTPARKIPEQDEPGTEDPGMEDPGIYDPGSDIPDIDIPAGPTKDELDRQIREKEELLKSLDLDKRTAGLETDSAPEKAQRRHGHQHRERKLSKQSAAKRMPGWKKRSSDFPLWAKKAFYITGAVAETAYDKIEQGMDVHRYLLE